MVLANSYKDFTCSRTTQDTCYNNINDTYTGLSPSMVTYFPKFYFKLALNVEVLQPLNCRNNLVWAIPRSLATTSGITIVFYSSSYLDVSVHLGLPPCRMTCLQHAGLPHSEILRIKRLFAPTPKLIAAYHVLHRL